MALRSNMNRPWGQPYIDEQSASQMFSELAPLANTMKNDDMFRAQEMLRFEQDLANRAAAQQEQRRFLASQQQPMRTPFGPNKQKIVNYAPPTAMQSKFRDDEIKAEDNRFRMGALAQQQAGQLNQAIVTGKMRDDAEMARLTAEINSREKTTQANRESEERLADKNLQAKTKESETERNFKRSESELDRKNKTPQTFNMDDPNNPGKQLTVTMGPDGKARPVTLDGQNVGGVTKPGTKSGLVQPNPQALTDIRNAAQETLNEISTLLDDKDNLTDVGKWATGATAGIGKLPLPTDARAGQASLKRIHSQQVLNLIGKLKAQSKTGATGFGQMNMRELGILEAAADKLSDPYQKESVIRNELLRIRGQLRLMMQDEAKDGTEPKTKLSPAQLRQKYGG